MIKTIIFDLGGVLVEIDYHRFLTNISREFNVSIAELLKNSTDGSHNDYMKGIISSDQFLDSICTKYDQSLSFKKFEQLWNSILMRQNEAVAKIVTHLHKKYTLAIMSNIDPIHFSYCVNNFPIIKTFKEIFLSYEHHLLKPDPEFFELVANKLDKQAIQCLLIDDLPENVHAAKTVGFQVIHFKNADQLQEDLEKIGIL